MGIFINITLFSFCLRYGEVILTPDSVIANGGLSSTLYRNGSGQSICRSAI